MSRDAVLALLRERTGLDPAALGGGAVAAAVDAGMRRLGLVDPTAFAARLAAEPTAFAELVDAVVVPETWFFRGGELFYYLAEHVRTAVRRRTPFRVLSLPCSSGEEPYSLVLALAEVGVAAGWQIDGVDISPPLLEAAQRGVFSELSFRQTPPEVRRRYFSSCDGGWLLRPELAASVRFLSGNLLDLGLIALERPYDLVFCRNLLIYLTPEARRQAVAALERLTVPHGLLCLGHADPLDADGRWRRCGPDGYFLWQRAEVAAAPVRAATVRERPPHRRSLTVAAPTAAPSVDLDALLGQAREHADAGRLDQALEVCRAADRRHGPTADFYALSGIIHQARREPGQAVHCFRQALYLAPDHREALMHLMLLYQHLGEHDQAGVLRARLGRLATSANGGEP